MEHGTGAVVEFALHALDLPGRPMLAQLFNHIDMQSFFMCQPTLAVSAGGCALHGASLRREGAIPVDTAVAVHLPCYVVLGVRPNRRAMAESVSPRARSRLTSSRSTPVRRRYCVELCIRI